MEGELLIRKPLRFGSFGRFRKVAAVAGVAIVSLAAIATGITVKLRSDSNTASIAPSTELAQNHCKDTLPTTGLPEAASIPTEPIIFENRPLEEILDSIKIRHNVAAQFRSENAKAIRLYFRWNPDRPLPEIIGLLNNFRQFSIEQSGDTLLIN